MIQITVTRNLIGFEDLLLGFGSVEQVRAGSPTELTKINAQNIPYQEDPALTIKEKMEELQALAESLSLLDEDGDYLTGYLNTSELALNLDGRLWRRTPTASPNIAEIYYGDVLVLQYNKTTGNIIPPEDLDYIAADTALEASLLSYIDDQTTDIVDSLGSAAYLDEGTSAGNLVALDGDGKLPAVDGSQLTGLPDSVPIGAIFAVPYTTPDTGYLECNGQVVSRTTYATLFAKIGTSFGAGDGSTTFSLPDLRGEFIRGWDHGRNVDNGRGINTSQADAFKSHNHSYVPYTVPRLFNNPAGSDTSGGARENTAGGTRSTNSTGSNETRPRNVALMYVIKAL